MSGIRRRLEAAAEKVAYKTGRFSHRNVRGPWFGRRLVFVCTGNICRSAYAHQVALVNGLNAASCGMSTTPDLPADDTAIDVAASRGVDLTLHRTKAWQSFQLLDDDIVLAAQLRHAMAIRKHRPSIRVPVVLMNSLLPTFSVLWDPYSRDRVVYNSVFDDIDRVIGAIATLASTDRSQTAI